MSLPPWVGSPKKSPRVARKRSSPEVKPGVARTRSKPVRLGDGVVKCLAIRDPWISLIGKGQKTIELRTKRTHYRGTVVLCAAKRRAKGRGSESFSDDGPKGVALYVADLVSCREADFTDTKRSCTAPVAGEFAWILANVRAIPVPQKIHNWLGLFDAKADLVKYLKKAKVI